MRRRSTLVSVIFWVSFAGTARAAEEGLVAGYDFSEGSGSILHDRSGNRNDGRILGAQWVKYGKVRVLIEVRGGEFLIHPSATYTITAPTAQEVQADASGILSFPLDLRGETEVAIRGKAQ